MVILMASRDMTTQKIRQKTNANRQKKKINKTQGNNAWMFYVISKMIFIEWIKTKSVDVIPIVGNFLSDGR